MAGSITNILNFLLIFIFMLLDRDLKEARVWPDRRILLDLKDYISDASSNAACMFIGYWAWEQQTLAAGIMGIEE